MCSPPPPPPTHTHLGRVGGELIRLTLHPKRITNGYKIVQWDHLYQKDIVSEIKPVWTTLNCMVSIAAHRDRSDACPLHLQADPRSTIVCRYSFMDFFLFH